jgi:NAD(P)H dehydrogenase (quinone)
MMKVLIVYAHPNPKSFNKAIVESFAKGLEEAGHTYQVNDLYANNFDPVFKGPDFTQFAGGEMPKDVLDEQKKISQADALVFVYPVWWWGPPAILKGWFDRVLSHGFAYKLVEGKPQGLLPARKALIINTTLAHQQAYETMGVKPAMDKIMKDQIIRFCGIQDVDYPLLYAPQTVDDETRKRYLDQVYQMGKGF